MLKGASTEDHWTNIACALDIALVLCEMGIGKEYEGEIITALDGVFRAKVRAEKSNSWRLDGEAIKAINIAFDVHSEQIRIATKQEMTYALNEVRRRMKKGNIYT